MAWTPACAGRLPAGMTVMGDAGGHYLGGCQRRSSRALLTTLTELSAIAAPATTGLRKPMAASGMPAVL